MSKLEENLIKAQRQDRFAKIRDFFATRQDAYRAVFAKGPMSDKVLKDLAKFCRANESTFLPDPRAHAVLEGRREVWLRIQAHLNLSTEQLMELNGGRNVD